MEKKIDNAVLPRVPNAGHMAVERAHEQCTSAILTFVNHSTNQPAAAAAAAAVRARL